MTETLFEFDNGNYRECQSAYRGDKNQEYYLGDYTIQSNSVVDVRAERKAVGSCSVIQLRSRTGMSFNRRWSHIREDATDVTVLWFVKRGRLLINHQAGRCIASAGEFALTKSLTPFSMECETDSSGVHEVLHVIVPTHEFRQFVPNELQGVFTLPSGIRQLLVAEHLFNTVYDDGDELSACVEQKLIETALTVLAEAFQRMEACHFERQTLADRRLQDVLRFIDKHLSDASLSTVMVAEACGISSRYLSFLLKQQGTPFSKLVWNKRLQAAERWLASTTPGDISIAEIAFRVGFKSPAHFSRMFKREYNKGPREYRSELLAQRAQSVAEEGFYSVPVSGMGNVHQTH